MHTTPRAGWGDFLAIGFGTAVAMWTVGYICRLPGVHVPPVVLFITLIAVLLAGGLLAGRHSPRGVAGAALAGLITGLINLLVLGSLLSHPEQGTILPTMLLWLPGSIAATVAVCVVGGVIGNSLRPRTGPAAPPVNWSFAFACVAALATLVLLSVGGTVTGFEAGLAVPDWPNSYGHNMFLFPLARMTGGIYYEHAHRLFGSLVGMTTVVLAVYLGFVERRGWVKWIAVAAVAMVITQGTLGGLRVTGRLTLSQSADVLSPSTALAVVHGVFGQCFFATLVILAATLSTAWQSPATPRRPAATHLDLQLGYAALVGLIVQLTFGALLRHATWGLLVHVIFAVVVIMLVGAAALRSWASDEKQTPALAQVGGVTLLLLAMQLMLGMFALVVVLTEPAGKPSTLQVLVTTAHQTTGALLLSSSAALVAWRHRLFSHAILSEPTADSTVTATTG
ncbi:MAG: COX15/CtaA family protein [Phycisphaerae bacterium]